MMALRRYNAKRDANEGGIIAALEALGCLVYRIDTPVDLLVLYRGTIHLCEVKQRKGKLTSAQSLFAQYWPIHILRSVDDAIALVQRRAA